MRLLIVMADLRLGGSQVAGIELGRALVDLGHDVRVAAHPGVGADVAATVPLRVEWLPPMKSPLRRVRQLRSIMTEFAPDLVITLEVATILTTLTASRLAHARTVAYVLGPRIPWYVPDQLNVFVAMPALLEFSKQWRSEFTHLLHPPVRLATPLDAQLETRSNAPKPLTVLAVSRLVEPYKGAGLLALVRAIEFLGSARLHIVGDGPFRQRLEQEAERVNEALDRQAIVFFGAESDPSKRFTSTSIIAGSGMTVIEAAASGVPAVVLGRDGFACPVLDDTIESLISTGFFGAGGPFADPEALADLIRRTVTNDDRSSVGPSLRSTYAPKSIAAVFLNRSAEIGIPLVSLPSMARALVRKGHYRLRRRAILERDRRRFQDVDEIENNVNRLMREYPIRRLRGRRLRGRRFTFTGAEGSEANL